MITETVIKHGGWKKCIGFCTSCDLTFLLVDSNIYEIHKELKAAITGDYGLALQAFLLNPLVIGGGCAKKLLDEMLVAHKKYLPQFTLQTTLEIKVQNAPVTTTGSNSLKPFLIA